MAIFNDDIAFASPPRTGNTWVHRVLKTVMGLALADDGRNHSVDWIDHPDQFKFTVVRDPSDWLRSWWGCGMRGRHRRLIGVDVVDKLQECNQGKDMTFEIFIDRYLNDMPGHTGKVFDYYTEGADKVLRVEQLHYEFEKMVDEDWAVKPAPGVMAKVLRLPPTNITTSKKREEWPHSMWHDAVIESEKNTAVRFGYEYKLAEAS